MLRYRESLGLLPSAGRGSGTHRHYGEEELRAAAYAIRLESRYDVSPKALAFALRALTEPQVHAELRELGRLCGRLPSELAALHFDQQKAQRLLRPTR
ncbi:MAG: MerR family transcriptional regulator [Propionibacteriales bacterium]|nr:MerR family transcriptional regulator [Propionibacteriales bacterium]